MCLDQSGVCYFNIPKIPSCESRMVCYGRDGRSVSPGHQFSLVSVCLTVEEKEHLLMALSA